MCLDRISHRAPGVLIFLISVFWLIFRAQDQRVLDYQRSDSFLWPAWIFSVLCEAMNWHCAGRTVCFNVFFFYVRQWTVQGALYRLLLLQRVVHWLALSHSIITLSEQAWAQSQPIDKNLHTRAAVAKSCAIVWFSSCCFQPGAWWEIISTGISPLYCSKPAWYPYFVISDYLLN